MMAMMTEMAKPGENHKILQEGAGSWTYTVKMWMSPDAPAMESSGTSVGRSVFDGRYLITEHTGKMQMPGADGKMTDMEFKGIGGFVSLVIRLMYAPAWHIPLCLRASCSAS